ncbi:ring-cleaving dioxygenase [Barrientosiimonas marina]|uniref:Ring-cleaving dioxygenase n=1 Tax=Lentibacillus kimchii TaxID=1542911 RepID=A0ABW2UVU0_9BACI
MKGLKGIHHVTAITSSAEKNYEFFTYILGMRLVKKTVNQDDIGTYHLFFADDTGNPGTDMTFFDFQGAPKGTHGTNEIGRIAFRVPSDEALDYWLRRFDRLQVEHNGIQTEFDKKVLPFVDFDGQQYQLISDENNSGVTAGTPWEKGPIPEAYAIAGLGPIRVLTDDYQGFKHIIENVLGFEEMAHEGSDHLFEIGEGGNGAQVIVEYNTSLPVARQGYGTVHHSAFRVEDRDGLDEWIAYMQHTGLPNSGYVNRHFFESLYLKVPSQILFEIATDGPGFMGDEPYETLGETLSLPPALEPKREKIESYVRPIDTVRSTKDFIKERE